MLCRSLSLSAWNGKFIYYLITNEMHNNFQSGNRERARKKNIQSTKRKRIMRRTPEGTGRLVATSFADPGKKNGRLPCR